MAKVFKYPDLNLKKSDHNNNFIFCKDFQNISKFPLIFKSNLKFATI